MLLGRPTALQDGRYTWRHDSVLLSIFRSLQQLEVTSMIFADFPGLRASEASQSTIPLKIISTSSRPDIVIVHMQTTKVALLELTICGNTLDAMNAAHTRKFTKEEYLHLLSDLRRRGWQMKYITIEIDALGHLNPICLSELADNFPMIPLLEWKNILRRGAITAINCSQAIFMARANRQWTGPPYIQ